MTTKKAGMITTLIASLAVTPAFAQSKPCGNYDEKERAKIEYSFNWHMYEDRKGLNTDSFYRALRAMGYKGFLPEIKGVDENGVRVDSRGGNLLIHPYTVTADKCGEIKVELKHDYQGSKNDRIMEVKIPAGLVEKFLKERKLAKK